MTSPAASVSAWIHAPADRLSFAPDCGLSHNRSLGRQGENSANMAAGVRQVRAELGL